MATAASGGNFAAQLAPHQPLELLHAVVSAVLAALPPRFVPSRCFVSSCLELVAALMDAWLVAGALPNISGACRAKCDDLQYKLGDIVGTDCAQAWWTDAAEISDVEEGGLQHQVGGTVGRNATCATLVALMERSAPSSSRPSLQFGAAWVMCALDDVVGSVVVHTTRKSAAVVSSRPTTAGGSRPLTSGSRPVSSSSSVARPAVPNSAGGKVLAHVPSSKQSQVVAAAIAAESRLRLITLKHFVSAVRSDDDGLRACPVLEMCLAEVATGVVPHVSSTELLTSESYCARLRQWTDQEGAAGGAAAAEQAMAQALKTFVAAVVAPATLAARRSPQARSEVDMAVAPVGADEGSARQTKRGQGWLPKAFVREFNAEGEEVEQEVSEPEAEEYPLATALKKPASGSTTTAVSSSRSLGGSRRVSFGEQQRSVPS
mmetsp:Transcript_86197/g.247362  ORF Transcript_86197/g.247362 Transcript_86197/m.247362 type:complete len:432 (-) Transcript_86197:31-1326(-)